MSGGSLGSTLPMGEQGAILFATALLCIGSVALGALRLLFGRGGQISFSCCSTCCCCLAARLLWRRCCACNRGMRRALMRRLREDGDEEMMDGGDSGNEDNDDIDAERAKIRADRETQFKFMKETFN